MVIKGLLCDRQTRPQTSRKWRRTWSSQITYIYQKRAAATSLFAYTFSRILGSKAWSYLESQRTCTKVCEDVVFIRPLQSIYTLADNRLSVNQLFRQSMLRALTLSYTVIEEISPTNKTQVSVKFYFDHVIIDLGKEISSRTCIQSQ